MEVQVDYRNAKYQGFLDEGETDRNSHQREGYGILIDDDLSLYAS